MFVMLFASACTDSNTNEKINPTNPQSNPGTESTKSETEVIPGTTLAPNNQSAPLSSKKTTSHGSLTDGNISKDNSVILSGLAKLQLAIEVKSVTIFDEKYPVESFPETSFAPGSGPIISDGVFAAEDVFVSVLLELEPLDQTSDSEKEYSFEEIILLDTGAPDIETPSIFIMPLGDSIEHADYSEDAGNFYKVFIRSGESADVLLGFMLPTSSSDSENLYLAFGSTGADAWYVSLTDIISREG